MQMERIQPIYAATDESPGFLLWQVTNMWQRQQRAALEEMGLTHVQFVLLAGAAWLTRNGEQVTQAQLAQHARTDVMMTSEVLRTLERKELIVRVPHPYDSRAKSLQVTCAGYTLVQRANVLVEEVDRQFFTSVDGDVAQLIGFLRRLRGD